jgi:large subunit ribosomal protein L22
MEARAVSRYVRISPRKARTVADLVRGKSVDQALSILALTSKKASPILKKAIMSAAANARFMNDEGVELDNEDLFIKDIRIDEGPTMKRIRPRAQGRAYRINKPMSHIRVIVEAEDQ